MTTGDREDHSLPVPEPAAEESADEVAPKPVGEHQPAGDDADEPPADPWWQK